MAERKQSVVETTKDTWKMKAHKRVDGSGKELMTAEENAKETDSRWPMRAFCNFGMGSVAEMLMKAK